MWLENCYFSGVTTTADQRDGMSTVLGKMASGKKTESGKHEQGVNGRRSSKRNKEGPIGKFLI